MTKTLLRLLIPTLLLSSACTTVGPGYVGLRVNMYGTQRGVDSIPIVTGRVAYNPITEDIYEYPVFIQRVEYAQKGDDGDESISFNSVEGSVVNADIAVSLGFMAEKVPHIFVEFRRDADVLVRGYVHDQVRTAFNEVASKMKAMEIIGEKKVEFLNGVTAEAKRLLEPKGFKVDQISIVSDFRLDPKVGASISAVIEAKQVALKAEAAVLEAEAKAKQQIATAEGEAKSILLVATAQAEANEVLNKSLTDQLIRNKAIEKWNGTLPQFTGGSGAVPFINLQASGK